MEGTALRSLERFSVAVAVSAGLCGAALALSPDGAATPLRTGGAGCVDQLAAAAPVAPMALPGPVAAPVPLAPVVPVAPVVPPVPLAPIVPVAGAGALPADGLAAAPLTKVAGTGKGVPTNPPPALAADPVVLPGPPLPVALTQEQPAPIPAVLTGSTLAAPGCAAVAGPTG